MRPLSTPKKDMLLNWIFLDFSLTTKKVSKIAVFLDF